MSHLDELMGGYLGGFNEAIKRATLTAWVIVGTYERPNGDIESMTEIVEALLSKPPHAEDCLGAANAVRVVKATVFPATHFLDLKVEDRPGYLGAFRYYQMWSRARAVRKPIGELIPHKDFDPIYLDAEYRRWLNPGVRWEGD